MSHDIGYYDHTRFDALALLPPYVDRVLEVGCGTGMTLAELKRQRRCAWIGGVEITEIPADIASQRVDRLWRTNIETSALDIPTGSLDALLCLDVLEHLVNPWATLQRLATLLKSGGTVVVSLPNVRNHRVLRDLLIRGQWTYQPAGILDRTHLRFFTRRTAVELIKGAGFRIDRIVPLRTPKRWKVRWFLRQMVGPRMDEFIAEQFLISGIKS